MRKLGLISSLWAALLFFPLTGNTLGLGEIEISSFLNQPLKAEIAVISARPGEVDDLLISLASRDAFDKAGLDRPAELSKLRFSVEKSDDGQSARILVSTKAPLVEPFLSFLVEADWAKGRLLREFTVLLDPPSFAQQAETSAAQLAPEPQQEEPSTNLIIRKAPTQQQSVSKPANSQHTASQPIAMTESGSVDSAQIAVERPVESVTSMRGNTESLSQIVVNRGDTLWRIASDLKEKQHSVSQMMLALQMMNPDAFGNDNINNLKVGAVLRVPDRDTMNKLSKQEAQAQVLDQNGLWDDYLARKSASVSSGTPLAAAGVSGAQKKSSGQLKLVAPGDGKSTNASLDTDSSSADSNQLRKKLALAEEELEAARLKNNDLNSRVGILEGQLKKFEELQKLVQIQDNSLAQLQESVTNPAAMKPPVESAPPVVEMMQEPAPLDSEKPTNEMIAAAGEIMATESRQNVEPVVENAGPAMPAESVKSADSDIVPAPVIVTEVSGPSADGGFLEMLPSLDDLLNDPVMLGGIGGVLALLFGLLFLNRKKSENKEEGITLEEPEDLTDDDPTPIHVPSVTKEVGEEGSETGETSITQTTKFNAASELSESESEEDEFARTAIISAEDMPDMEEASSSSAAEQDDVLNEVDVYLAYGLYDNAEDLLKESLENSPDRADYRAKLLDTYFATKNADAFINEATMLKSLGNAANRFWDRVQVMGYELSPENDLFSGAEGKQVSLEELAYSKPDSADFDISADDDNLSFSETDFDLSGDSDADSFDLSATSVMKAADENDSEVDSLDVIDIDFPDLEEDEEDKFAEVVESSGLKDKDSDLDESDLITGTDDMELDRIETANSDELEGFNLEDELEGEVVNLADDVDMEADRLSDESLSFDLSDEIEEIAEQDPAVADEAELITHEEIDITGDDVSEVEEIQLDPTQEAPSLAEKVTIESELDTDDDEVKFSFEGEDSEALAPPLEEDELTNATQVITAADIESSVVPDEFAEAEVPLEDGLDFDMSDIDENDLQTGGFTPSDEDTLSQVRPHADDITEFKPADFTGQFEAVEDAEDDAAIEVDTLAGLDKTGTFAPGDFNEESAQEAAAAALRDIDDIDDIEDLMLPDDVDEVGTKLDLAKAFIDMGDVEGARSSLEEVLVEGTDEQKAEATELISQIN